MRARRRLLVSQFGANYECPFGLRSRSLVGTLEYTDNGQRRVGLISRVFGAASGRGRSKGARTAVTPQVTILQTGNLSDVVVHKRNVVEEQKGQVAPSNKYKAQEQCDNSGAAEARWAPVYLGGRMQPIDAGARLRALAVLGSMGTKKARTRPSKLLLVAASTVFV